MEITLNTEVECADGIVGRSTYLIINPVSEEVTHLVVRSNERPHTERLVPSVWIAQSSHDGIVLSCTQDEFEDMEPFIETEFIKVDIPRYTDGGLGWPYVTTSYSQKREPIQHMNIPVHTRELRRNTPIMATDGRVGRVDELLVGPANKHITHIVMRKGHLFGERDVVIPLSAIKKIEDDLITLNLDKKAIGDLETAPIHRHFTSVRV